MTAFSEPHDLDFCNCYNFSKKVINDSLKLKNKVHIVPDSIIKKLVHRIEIERQLDSLKNAKINNLLFSLKVSHQMVEDYSFRDSLKTVQLAILSDSLSYCKSEKSRTDSQILLYRYSILGILVILIFSIIF